MVLGFSLECEGRYGSLFQAGGLISQFPGWFRPETQRRITEGEVLGWWLV